MKKNRLLFTKRLIISVLASALICLMFSSPGGVHASDTVTVTIDRNTPYLVSKFEIGATYTHSMWEYGHPTAVARAKQLLVDGNIRYHNIHIMGWGTDNPEPTNDNYNFDSLDERVNFTLSMPGAIPVITFCTAPGWMKVSGEDWNMNDRVATEHFDDFAELCSVIAQRYPQVKHFQVWNELKGFWDEPQDYITMYNMVYDAVKAVRPDAIIGGPYTGGFDFSFINSWYNQKHGADFICWDEWLQGWPPENNTDEAWQMARTSIFGDEAAQVRTITDLPIWISEYYAGGAEGTSSNWDFIAANHASCYYHSLINDTSVALLWGHDSYLFSSTASPSGGQPTKLYNVVKIFNTHFGPGTQLYSTTSSSEDINVLASETKTLLINKRNSPVTVVVNGTSVNLVAYEVKLLDADLPAQNNLALNKTAYASSAEPENPVEAGNDGDTSTRWCAINANTGHWWMVDLGAHYNLTGCEIMWEFARAYKYRIDVSSDGVRWTTVVNKTNNTDTSQIQSVSFNSNYKRYVRITVTGGLDSHHWASFYEFRVFGE